MGAIDWARRLTRVTLNYFKRRQRFLVVKEMKPQIPRNKLEKDGEAEAILS